ncbi:MAG: SDR family oxidoreductase [Gaiellaceae bacterium]
MAKQARAIGGRVVAITGGARGIGKATAAALVREGATVAIGDIDVALAQSTAEGLGPNVSAYHVDVTRRPSFADFLNSVERDLGPLDVLVNNAGIMPIGSLLEEDDDTAHRLVDINVHGVINGVKEALPRMLAHGSGHVVNLASVAGKAGFPHLATYCATKHAVVGLSESMRAELRGTAIEVTCVMPSLVNTELTSGIRAGRGVDKVEPEDVAAAILGALREPRFEVYVPRSVGRIKRFFDFLPRPLAEALGRVLDADKLMVQADMGTRAAYERRIAQAEEEPERLETSEV